MIRSCLVFVSSATAMILLVASHSQAAGPGGKGRGTFGKGGAMQVAMVKRFDQNGDGKLNAQEMAAARQARGLKANSPAIPGSSEGKGANPANAPGREAILKRFDKDGDGTLNADERAAARKTLDNRKSR